MSSWATPAGAVSAFAETAASLDGRAPQRPLSAVVNHHNSSNVDNRGSSVLSRQQKALFLQLDEILHDIASTEEGTSKKWLNVQPCVVTLCKLLVASSTQHEDALAAMHEELNSCLRSLSVLANDARLKEERHALEKQEQLQEREALLAHVSQLSAALDASLVERDQLKVAITALASRVSLLEEEKQEERHWRSQSEGVKAKGEKEAKLPRDHSASPPSLSASDSSHEGSRPSKMNHRSSLDRQGKKSKNTSALLVAELHDAMLEEIAELRAQWEAYFRRNKGRLVNRAVTGESSEGDNGRRRHAGRHSGTVGVGARHLTNGGGDANDEDLTESDDVDDEGRAVHQPARRTHQRSPYWERPGEVATSATHDGSPQQEGTHSSSSPDVEGYGGEAQSLEKHTLFPPQKARWLWLGNQASRFSPVTRQRGRSSSPSPVSFPAFRASPTGRRSTPQKGNRYGGTHASDVESAGSPAIAFDDVRLHDSRSGCWYSAGAWPCALVSEPPPVTRQRERDNYSSGRVAGKLSKAFWRAAAQWGCFDWCRPGTIRLCRAGVYRFTLSLLTARPSASLCGGGGDRDDGLGHSFHRTHANSTFSEWPGGRKSGCPRAPSRMPTLALYVNDSRVLTSAAVVSASGGDGGASSTLLLVGAHNGDAHHFFGGHSKRETNGQRPRPCCGPAQHASYTVSGYCGLEAGDLLQVRCHNFHDTKATVEAFVELEYIV